ncbi:MAG: hypothetical protein JOZ16_18925 [Methylobacteriaceae bacterium]|nr:hypothetical protein [Methylobacteriaceae bacterium]
MQEVPHDPTVGPVCRDRDAADPKTITPRTAAPMISALTVTDRSSHLRSGMNNQPNKRLRGIAIPMFQTGSPAGMAH